MEIAIALGREQFDQQHMRSDSETQSDDDPFPDYDVSTRAAVERLRAEPVRAAASAAKTLPPARPAPTTTPLDATKQLALFRPPIGNVAALRSILEARADPNVVVKPGEQSPLRKVIWSAPHWNCVTMRQLLLDYGAKESRDDTDRWQKRRAYDAIEPAYLRNFHRDDREG